MSKEISKTIFKYYTGKKKVTPSQTQTITNNNSVSKERRVFKDCKCYPISGRDLFFFPYPKEKGMESYHEAPKGTKKKKKQNKTNTNIGRVMFH